ncbi:uncharacterized protein LOC122387584 [Amphibalanus amphitrite]|uniref:uncharacterized protein LOC122387584 n=1 Tax=Amphibalanus amphitrite TaxID=1232801 RepID=UPI001C9170E3|nr:uncharacterized protein LOC122387584 [Amphibalanus amphitrite]
MWKKLTTVILVLVLALVCGVGSVSSATVRSHPRRARQVSSGSGDAVLSEGTGTTLLIRPTLLQLPPSPADQSESEASQGPESAVSEGPGSAATQGPGSQQSQGSPGEAFSGFNGVTILIRPTLIQL